MKGLNYQSTLSYTFSKSNKEIKEILEFDGFKDYKIDEDLKIVEYTINHSNSIQLSLLLYLQQIKFIQLTIAQQIQLCLDIYNKYKQLEQQNIQHNYLSSDRIWLNISNKQHQITILPNILYYTIHFVGYDCPFYERDNYLNSQIKDDQAIKNTIINILQIAKNRMNDKKKKLDNISTKDQNMKEKQQQKKEKLTENQIIFKVLLDEGIYKSFDKFILSSQFIFEKYENINNLKQRLKGVDKNFAQFNIKRNNRNKDVINNLVQIQQTYNNKQFCELSSILFQMFKKIADHFRNATFYEQQMFTEIIIYEHFQNQIEHIDNQIIQKVIDDNKESIMKDFKFELDLQSIQDDINQQLSNKFKTFRYFFNDFKFLKDQKYIMNQIQKLKEEVIKEVVTQILQDYLQLLILKLEDDLM
ncbi:unnamed protein product [Paramecium sonneborni]|uniref:Uncharacterized protein n=1 Tax=Paramecium sonneborni TaxID=65129 RepID=A0A8S1LJ20_9CILI|nr:unnamed protein product [Paramecium sonneborni]